MLDKDSRISKGIENVGSIEIIRQNSLDSVDNSMQPCILSTDSMSGIEDDVVLDSSKHSEMDNNIHNTNLILISTPLSVMNLNDEISSSLSRIESIDLLNRFFSQRQVSNVAQPLRRRIMIRLNHPQG